MEESVYLVIIIKEIAYITLSLAFERAWYQYCTVPVRKKYTVGDDIRTFLRAVSRGYFNWLKKLNPIIKNKSACSHHTCTAACAGGPKIPLY